VVVDIGENLSQLDGKYEESISYTYSGLEARNLLIGQGISLGNDWDQVDLGMKTTHDFDVKRLQGMTGWLDEVHTGVDSVVNDVHTVDFVLGVEVGIEALLNVVHNWSPGLIVVDEITETWGINNSQA
jgi:hypothetical protein